MIAILQYVLLTSLRDRLLTAVLIALLIVTGLVHFLAETALVENELTARALGSGALRLVLACGLIVAISFHFRQMFANREIAMLVTRPLSRSSFVVGCALAYGLIATALALVVVVLVVLSGYASVQGLGIWALGMVCEAWIVATLALAFALILPNAVSASMASLGFYLLSRVMTLFVATAESPMSRSHASWVDAVSVPLMQGLAKIFPRLDLFGQSEWLVYGTGQGDAQMLVLQTLIFVPLVLVVGVIDFRRKEL
jgi:hypothetical protein